MDLMNSLSAIAAPILFAGMIFFIHRFIKQNDDLQVSFITLQTKIAVLHRDIQDLPELKEQFINTMEEIHTLGLKVEKALVLKNEIEFLKAQVSDLKHRDDLLWEEVRKKHQLNS